MGFKLGFPRALFYYLYYPFWHAFFSALDCEVVTSNPTSKLSLDWGVQEAVNDACLPIKLYHGHVAELKESVDALFLPRLVSVRRLKSETFCPKFLGLPDMIKNSISGLPQVIDTKIDLGKGMFPLFMLCREVARAIGKNGWPVHRAYLLAKRKQDQFHRLLLQGIPADLAIAKTTGGCCDEVLESEKPDISLAVLGYPYLIYDRFVNVGLFSKLSQLKVKPFTVEMVPPQDLNKQARYLPKNLFWHFSNRTIWATFYYLKQKKVDGIIHVTAFGCGPDAMVDKLMELEAKNHARTPFITLSLDEHTGEAGVSTRIEAFVDMLRLRRAKDEDFISHHG